MPLIMRTQVHPSIKDVNFTAPVSDHPYGGAHSRQKGRGHRMLVLIWTALIMGGAQAQLNPCDQPPAPPPPPALSIACGVSINYAPLIAEHTPVKRVRIALHVFQKDDGTGNFQNTPEHIAYLEGVVNSTNIQLTELGPQQIEVNGVLEPYGTSPYIMDSRIQLELVGIYFHPHTSDWMLPNNSTAYTTYVLNDADNYGLTWSDKYEVEHVFLRGPNGCCSGRASGIGMQGWLHSGSWYSHFLDTGPTQGHWGIPQHFMHELMHAFGLSHNFVNCFYCPPSGAVDQPDQCADNDPIGQNAPDVGTSTNMMDYFPLGYNFIGAGLSECQLGRVHYYLDGNALVGGSGTIVQTVVKDYCTYDPAATITIDQDVSWLSSKKLKGNVVVEPGATLTIKCRVHMPAGGRIIVKQGARLIVDEGTITNLCDEKWAGIEAWGTTTQHQEPATHPTYQGLVVLKNGAVIEHALTGFINWKPNDWNSLGGVLQVQGTIDDVGGTFRNCWRGAEFMEYHNFYPSSPSHAEKNDNSYFRHAVFTVDDDYRGNDDFDAHVRLYKVKGISFRQCDFINAQATTSVDFSDPLGWGIYSFDAGFSVSGQCAEQLPLCEYGSGQPEPVCPEVALRPSRFIGLDHGIRAGSSGIGGYTFTVKDSYFENNVCGIYTDAVNNAAILRNKFIVGGRQVTLNGDDANFDYKHRGIFTTQANAFRVEENRFSKASTTYAGTEGVVVGYTSAYSNQVYKNTSSDMDYAFVAEGSNVDALHPTTTGLSFLCNQNAQNGEEDFKIRTNVQGNPPPDHSIKMFQGSTTKSAGNTFTPQQNGSSPYYNYHNEAEVLPITYFWELPPGVLNTGAYNAPWVQRNANASPHNTCPTRILCGGGVGPVRAALSPQIEQERLAYLNLKYVFESLLDGGDFDELKETIMESWPSDAWQLRNELIDKSPYLSTDILKEARLKNILPDAMYLEVCLANPEATQRDGFVKWVQFEAPVPLPEYMVAHVVASWDQRTWRTSLESEMGWHNGEYQRLNDELTRAMLTDSVAQPADSILVRWQLNPSLRARFGEVNTLLGQNRFDEAVALLEGLDANYILEKQGKQDRDDMLDLIGVIRPVIEGSGRTLMQLEPGELTALEEIAERQPSLAASYARNTLCYGYDICIPPVTGGVMQPKMLWVNVSGTEASTVPLLIVHPNPASTWVAFSHMIPAKIDQAQIRVLDPLGRVVHEAGIKTSPDQVIWDTRKIAAGSYMVELYNAGRLLDAQRVVVKP